MTPSEKASAVNGEDITKFLIVLTAALQAVHYFDLFFSALSILSNIIVKILEIKREDQQPQYAYSVLLLSVLITKPILKCVNAHTGYLTQF